MTLIFILSIPATTYTGLDTRTEANNIIEYSDRTASLSWKDKIASDLYEKMKKENESNQKIKIYVWYHDIDQIDVDK